MTKKKYSVEQQVKGFDKVAHDADVCVVGGGMAGLCAAIASARNGAKTVLVQDRAVLGGNASSEIRMWICGAHGQNTKETGILEEIQLENCYRNPTQVYSIWDSVLYEKAAFCPNLTLLLNTSCTGGKMSGKRLASITAWQLTSQSQHTIHAKLFIDCSGDSILAPITGAKVRIGREAAGEFDEDIEPRRADNRTMGNTLLLQFRETAEPQPFIAPKWAYKFRSPSDLPTRHTGIKGNNFWWLEVGGLFDTIRDAEMLRDELNKVAYGIVDYIKNYSPEKHLHENWGLEFMGQLPGKRENRRYVGDHILCQNEVRDGGRFEDIIAHGGWSMDDHHPAGLAYPGKPTIFHPAPSPFGIPYRSLYSKNVPNLLFAGRNISTTHAALSSTRVMGTTSILGQAAGTAAALCIRYRCSPRELFPSRIAELQGILLEDDQWLPGKVRQASILTQQAELSGAGRNVQALRDGHDRPVGEDSHAWTGAKGEAVELSWKKVVRIGGLRLVLDSNLNHAKRMPCSFPLKASGSDQPKSLLRRFRVEAQSATGQWSVIHREENNYQRLVRLPLKAEAKSLRIVPEETWGAEEVRIFSIDVLSKKPECIGVVPDGEPWLKVVAKIPAADLRPPESGMEATDGRKKVGA